MLQQNDLKINKFLFYFNYLFLRMKYQLDVLRRDCHIEKYE